MSDSITNMVGNAEPRGAAAAGFENAKAPLSDLFAKVLDKTAFADSMLSPSEFGLARAAERDYEVRQAVDDAAQDRADAAPSENDVAEVEETDDQPHDGDEAEAEAEAETENQSEEPAQENEAPASQQAALPQDVALAINAASQDTANPGLTAQPNAASGVVLESKVEGPTPGQARAAATNGAVQAATHKTANAGQAAHDVMARGNSEFGKAQSDAGAQLPDTAALKSGNGVDAAAAKSATGIDAAAAKPGLNTEAAAAKSGPVVEAAPTEKSQTKASPAQSQSQSHVAKGGDADGLDASLEKHDLLATASAKRAAELHNMKIRLEAHRGAIKKAIAQSNASSTQNTASSADKPSIEVTTSAAPPAAAALNGPSARPAALFNATAPGTLPGQAGVNGSTNMAIGEIVGNGAEQSSAAADRQTTTSNAARAFNLRPAPGQPAFQPAEQVKVHIQQMVKSGADRIHIKLSPAALGKVEVALELNSDKVVQAVVYAEKPETLDMLERDARVLQRAFEEAGMKFDSNSLTFQHGQPGNSGAELAEGDAQSQSGAAADADGSDGEEAADNDQPRRRQHDGMLDLEI